MSSPHPGYRIFILGAGFSALAGLPLATGLFREIRTKVSDKYGLETKFERDVGYYIRYVERCTGQSISSDDIDLEELMSFWDIEHFLGLRGGDTWSEAGNEAQIMTKRFLAKIIHDATPAASNLPDPYYEFAQELRTTDTIITFNYDVVLERALDSVGLPYRLFPCRFKDIGHFANTIDDSIEEITVLKMHGSVDWVDKSSYDRHAAYRIEERLDGPPDDPVFADPARFDISQIVAGPRNDDDPLNNIYRLGDVDQFYSFAEPLDTPFILSPSHVKMVYAKPFLGFWDGLGKSGGLNLGMSVIGFSLPEHDEYVRVCLYQLMRNYQGVEWDTELLGVHKPNLKLVDLRQNSDSIAEYEARYGFVDEEKTDYILGGFDSGAIKSIFQPGVRNGDSQ